ncbi:4Fe-4S dicluster domain-containing protein [Desulfonauticus submarinus]|uniref:4Fe-4S dicluster domain-containing protein n=1 Tax=Desulfonauticus submarinus TaxID=206665 RepID=A0A1H0DYA6_9BACT|nr:NIL domain-containing protein [Desulfonauticus submarinus]SDN75013.1 4Fe-4S dicluster domain-containing protein [Desulfonauticus submarinus]
MNKKYPSKIIALHFASGVSRQPMMCNLARKFDLTFNILKARITPKEEGHMIIELTGPEEDFQKGLSYLQENGVSIQEVAQNIARDENLCMHCGICLSLCLTGALSLNPKTRLIEFNPEKCTACGRCTKICPVKAMQVQIDTNGE